MINTTFLYYFKIVQSNVLFFEYRNFSAIKFVVG